MAQTPRNINVQPLSYFDIEFLRGLRNECRMDFFSTEIITPKAQERWWELYSMMGPDYQFFVIWQGDRRVGVFSLTPPQPDLPIFPTPYLVVYYGSIMVVKNMRGKGVIQAAAQMLKPDTAYVGYIREGNISSLRSCEKLGLTNRGIYEHPRYGRLYVVQRG